MEDDDDDSVGSLIRKEVADWDNEVIGRARFKGFSGQRCDWDQNYLFWSQLILKLARHLNIFIIRPSLVKNVWFNRGGLTPLCIDRVLFEMHSAGDILRFHDLVDPTSGRFPLIFRRLVQMVGLSRSSTPLDFTEDPLILSPLLKEKAVEVVKVLSENHWTSSCIITMRKFQDICGGSMEASAVLSHLSACGKAKYLVINKKDLIEGVKVSLSPGAVPVTTSLDYNVLHLIWTLEKLQQQLDVIDQRREKSRKSALASLKSGNKVVALRNARELKLASQSSEKCTTLLNRVEEVLRVIADAECSKKVSEAIQIGARAIKENKISVEEVEVCLQELDESIDAQKQVEKVLESTPSYEAIEDEDVENEFTKLELEVGIESLQVPISKAGVLSSVGEAKPVENAESLGNALSNLKLTDGATTVSVTQGSTSKTRNYLSEDLKLETA